ncbi:MAG: hypothetical protein LBL65_04640 [Campylobacteraceae bacterium]|nr:hypothetical protein [Campylobacteraceae bacterium]
MRRIGIEKLHFRFTDSLLQRQTRTYFALSVRATTITGLIFLPIKTINSSERGAKNIKNRARCNLIESLRNVAGFEPTPTV